MRPAAMAVIVVLMVSVTGGSEVSSASQLETALSRQSSERPERRLRHRHGSNLRHSRRRRPDQPPASAPLQLPSDLQESGERVELEHGRRRYAEPSGDFSVCCPAVEERTSPKAGTRRDGSLALLYTSADFQQVFFERSCDSEGGQGGARALPRRRHRCVQEYSYSYAVLDISGNKVLDLIRIRSGCRCEVKRRTSRRRKKRRRDRKKRAEIRRKRLRTQQRGSQSLTNDRSAS